MVTGGVVVVVVLTGGAVAGATVGRSAVGVVATVVPA
jgi:hypothetical protein